MILNKWRKSFVFGIIVIFIFSAMTPSIKTDDTSIIITTDESEEEYLTVFVFSWDGERINYYEESQSQEEFDNYISEVNQCTTSEDAWALFQSYGLVPEDKTIEDFGTWAENEHNENQELIEQFKEEYYVEHESGEMDFAGNFVLSTGTIYAIFWCWYIPALAFIAESYYGGDVNYRCLLPYLFPPIRGPDRAQWRSYDYFYTYWEGWVGKFSLNPNWGPNFLDRTFGMLCWYAEFYLYEET